MDKVTELSQTTFDSHASALFTTIPDGATNAEFYRIERDGELTGVKIVFVKVERV